MYKVYIFNVQNVHTCEFHLCMSIHPRRTIVHEYECEEFHTHK